MTTYYIYNRQVDIQEAARQAGSVAKLKELIARAKYSACPEYAMRINGKNLTIAKRNLLTRRPRRDGETVK